MPSPAIFRVSRVQPPRADTTRAAVAAGAAPLAVNRTAALLVLGWLSMTGMIPALPAQHMNEAGSPREKPGEVLVTQKSELAGAIAEAKPGTVIKLKNGTWTDLHINFTGKGRETAPITLVAETPGEVVLTGNSFLTMHGEYLVADGLFFKAGLLSGRAPVVEITSASAHCRLSNTAIIDYSHTDKATRHRWVAVDGSHQRIDHCYFKGKAHMGPLLRNMPGSKHNSFDHNYFVDIPAFPQNGLEIIQVMNNSPSGDPAAADDGEQLVVERNLFERADGEGAEVISLKSNRNTIRNNTIRNTKGGIVIRSGHFNTVENNYIESDNVRGTVGVRVTGEGNTVSGNFIRGVTGYGIVLMTGEYIERPLTVEWRPGTSKDVPSRRIAAYHQSKKNRIINNVLLDNQGPDFFIGYQYLDKWPQRQMILLPEENSFQDNLVVKPQGVAFQVMALDARMTAFTPKPNVYAGNVLYCSTQPETVTAGVQYRPFERFTEEKKQYNFDQHHSLTEAEVGPAWAFDKKKAGDPLFQPRLENLEPASLHSTKQRRAGR